MSSNRKKQGPDFICIGAQKAGTTWLYDQLVHHPQIWLPVIKELHYFNFAKPHPQLKGTERYPWGTRFERLKFIKDRPNAETMRWLLRFIFAAKGPQWYRSLFPQSGHSITGELTPAYSTLDKDGVEYVWRTVPKHTKIFIILRNPVDRIWSGAKMDFRWRKENLANLSLNGEKELLRPTHLLRSAYSQIIPLWERRFEGRFGVFFYDDLVANPSGFLQEVLTFLSVDSEWESPAIAKRSNDDKSSHPIPLSVKSLLDRELHQEVAYVLNKYPERHLEWA